MTRLPADVESAHTDKVRWAPSSSRAISTMPRSPRTNVQPGTSPPARCAQRAATSSGSATSTAMPVTAPGTLRCGQSSPPQRHADAGSGAAERHDRPAGVAGVQVYLGDVVEEDVEDLANAGLARPHPGCIEVIDLHHRHVPAHVSAAAFELARCGGVVPHWRDDLEERVTDREHGVAQPEEPDALVVERHAEAELAA